MMIVIVTYQDHIAALDKFLAAAPHEAGATRMTFANTQYWQACLHVRPDPELPP